MKKILLYVLTIITFILLIIAKDTNIFLSIFLLFIPLLVNVLFLKQEGLEIIRYNKITIIFYITICIIYYFVTYDPIATLILLLLMITYYFYNPKLKIQEEFLYVDKIIVSKKIDIPSRIFNNYKNAGIDLIKAESTEEGFFIKNNKELIKYYHEIELNRAKYENLVRSKKIQFISSLIVPFIIIFVFVFKLPNPLTNTNLLIIYFIISLTNIFLTIFLPSEQDIMQRKTRIEGDKLFSKEEKLFIYVNIFCVIAAITIPYMSILYSTNKQDIINNVFMTSFIITNFINIFYHINDSPTLTNIIKLILNKISILIIIINLLTFYIIHFLYDKYNILKGTNYLKILLIALVMIGWEDIIKLARFLKNRKKVKNGRNNK